MYSEGVSWQILRGKGYSHLCLAVLKFSHSYASITISPAIFDIVLQNKRHLEEEDLLFKSYRVIFLNLDLIATLVGNFFFGMSWYF